MIAWQRVNHPDEASDVDDEPEFPHAAEIMTASKLTSDAAWTAGDCLLHNHDTGQTGQAVSHLHRTGTPGRVIPSMPPTLGIRIAHGIIQQQAANCTGKTVQSHS